MSLEQIDLRDAYLGNTSNMVVASEGVTPTHVDVRTVTSMSAVVDRYSLTSPDELASWGWNARKYTTQVIQTLGVKMTDSEADHHAKAVEEANRGKRGLLRAIMSEERASA